MTKSGSEGSEPSIKQRSKHRKVKKASSARSTSWVNRLGGITSGAFRFAKRTGSGSYRVGKSILNSQDQLNLMANAGQSLKDLREVAGLTITEISDAVNLKDRSFWEAVEDGTATLSFELILRLSALLARNDPIPFILKYTRTYNPEIWRLLNDWGLGRLPLQYERERQFINIYRSQDAARTLSDEGFQTVLGFTRKAFEMSLHFIQESERLNSENERLKNENKTLHRALEKALKTAKRHKIDLARELDEEASQYREAKNALHKAEVSAREKLSEPAAVSNEPRQNSGKVTRTASNNKKAEEDK